MTYTLGVDLGTTFTAAAVDDGSGPVPLTLGSSTNAMPSVVALRDGAPVTGEAAEAVLRERPAAGVREAKRRLGDSTPFVVDGTPYGAEALLGLLLADVIKAATEQHGGEPASVVLSHPANWGDFRKELLSDTARVAGLESVGLITEPQAAAIHYVRSGELGVGQTAAVYDFGGGTFDAAVVRCAERGPELLGEAKGLERLGGIDLDQAILAHVNESVDGALRELDSSDPTAAAAMASVRAQCVAAKEALSTASEASISVALPGLTTQVRLTRAEFEDMVRPRIADTLAQLDAALQSADVKASDLSAVVLVGGTARIPLIAEMVATHTGVRVVASADHKTVVCAGAAAGDAPTAKPVEQASESGTESVADAPAFVVTGPASSDESTAYRGGVKKRRLVLVGGAAVLAAAGVAASATMAGATPADALDLLGLGDDAETDAGGDDGGMIAAKLDEFDVPEPEPPADEGAGADGGSPGMPAAGMPMGGGTPMARVAAMRPRGGGGGGGAARPASRPDGDDGPAQRPGAPGGGAQTNGDPEFLQTKAELLASIQKWQAPAGVDPKVADEFRAELLDRIQRFQAMPGESSEHALAAMRDEYQDQVKDFVQDQRIKDIIDEDAADDAQAAAVDAALDTAKAKLLAGLGGYRPPPGTDPEDFAAMRADVEALIQRYEAVPGQSADEALAELRYQYESRVRDMAQEMKIDDVAEDLAKDNTSANATTTVTEGSTTITYGPAYYNRATDPPRPSVTENQDGTRTVTFVNEDGRHVSIKTTESPDAAIDKYRDHLPPPPETPEHSPGGFMDGVIDRVRERFEANRLGLPSVEETAQTVVRPPPDPDPRVTTPQPPPVDNDPADPRVTMPRDAAASPGNSTVGDEDVVGDTDSDAVPPGFEPKTVDGVQAASDRDDDDAFAAKPSESADEFQEQPHGADDDDTSFRPDADDPFTEKSDDSADEFDSGRADSDDDDMDLHH